MCLKTILFIFVQAISIKVALTQLSMFGYPEYSTPQNGFEISQDIPQESLLAAYSNLEPLYQNGLLQEAIPNQYFQNQLPQIQNYEQALLRELTTPTMEISKPSYTVVSPNYPLIDINSLLRGEKLTSVSPLLNSASLASTYPMNLQNYPTISSFASPRLTANPVPISTSQSFPNSDLLQNALINSNLLSAKPKYTQDSNQLGSLLSSLIQNLLPVQTNTFQPQVQANNCPFTNPAPTMQTQALPLTKTIPQFYQDYFAQNSPQVDPQAILYSQMNPSSPSVPNVPSPNPVQSFYETLTNPSTYTQLNTQMPQSPAMNSQVSALPLTQNYLNNYFPQQQSEKITINPPQFQSPTFSTPLQQPQYQLLQNLLQQSTTTPLVPYYPQQFQPTQAVQNYISQISRSEPVSNSLQQIPPPQQVINAPQQLQQTRTVPNPLTPPQNTAVVQPPLQQFQPSQLVSTPSQQPQAQLLQRTPLGSYYTKRFERSQVVPNYPAQMPHSQTVSNPQYRMPHPQQITYSTQQLQSAQTVPNPPTQLQQTQVIQNQLQQIQPSQLVANYQQQLSRPQPMPYSSQQIQYAQLATNASPQYQILKQVPNLAQQSNSPQQSPSSQLTVQNSTPSAVFRSPISINYLQNNNALQTKASTLSSTYLTRNSQFPSSPTVSNYALAPQNSPLTDLSKPSLGTSPKALTPPVSKKDISSQKHKPALSKLAAIVRNIPGPP